MFKTKKTQFAIRKLAKGAVAVLLSFGILAGPSAPIVSAASEAIQNEMTDDTTSNEVTSDTTSVVEESVPVENNTAELLIILMIVLQLLCKLIQMYLLKKKQIQKHLLILSNQFKQKKLKVLLQLKM
ncbi:MAG: YSIRK-type signal peptide-containing protein [Lactobacillus amylovorus]|nr:YSIRK-type signal peptide-containing protein [Lactobacillus amylovorus]